jgi:putative RNA 2'-phosphotransferase
MEAKKIKKLSKYLSLILRHRPEKIKLQLDKNGWASVESLLEKVNASHVQFNKAELDFVVENNNKKRFSYNYNQTKIRANQGHSIDIELGYAPVEPPETLFHGTAKQFLTNIKAQGLQKMNRHHVHLSADKDTAINVGQRHGVVTVLTVQSKAMYDAGYEFFLSTNGVWLTDHVPVEYF